MFACKRVVAAQAGCSVGSALWPEGTGRAPTPSACRGERLTHVRRTLLPPLAAASTSRKRWSTSRSAAPRGPRSLPACVPTTPGYGASAFFPACPTAGLPTSMPLSPLFSRDVIAAGYPGVCVDELCPACFPLALRAPADCDQRRQRSGRLPDLSGHAAGQQNGALCAAAGWIPYRSHWQVSRTRYPQLPLGGLAAGGLVDAPTCWLQRRFAGKATLLRACWACLLRAAPYPHPCRPAVAPPGAGS